MGNGHHINIFHSKYRGDHESTARFCMVYVRLVNIFLMFSRAYRNNDVDLFIYALGEMCPIFFAGYGPNYARWVVRYYLNLVNMENSHPGIRHILQNGALSVNRSSRSFSRTPVNITLEQTVNADAVSRLTGIAAFERSAKRRWMLTRSVRSAIVNNMWIEIHGGHLAFAIQDKKRQ